ncbi:MAG: ribosome silencing factor [Chloroflexi bacterium RBG_13_68_17]|jgi:ribosome-associated protein|nr:MAG: ribosome silencing factor [Chloroflexi bacterium RBG_13_68_17]
MPEETLALAREIVETLDEKKGEDILLLDLHGVCSFTDYFVLCTCASERTLQALADEVTRRAKGRRVIPAPRREGDASSGWVLVDCGGVILHLFTQAVREYYRLEELWRAGKVLVRVA